MTYKDFSSSQFMTSLSERSDLEVYGKLKGAIYAIELFTGTDDIHTNIQDAITEGPDDEKIDILYVDRERKSILIIQSYFSETFRKEGAKPNKASDVAYATVVFLNKNISDIPARIRYQVQDARDAIEEGLIENIYIWFLHNCPETVDCERPLKGISDSINSSLNEKYPGKRFHIVTKQLGLESLDELYSTKQQPIIITDDIIFDGGLPGFVETKNGDWTSFSTSIQGSKLKELYDKYTEDKLFSANVRSYLGANKKDKYINGQIVESVKNDADDFFVLNNGITALVHDLYIEEFDENEVLGILNGIKGISIVNGAQTTGCISNADVEISPTLKVGVRFVKTSTNKRISAITKANNSQNKVISSDFRSSDQIQKRLRAEFNRIPDAVYMGGLRKELTPDEKRKLMPADSVAQVLLAFHGHPRDSYHEKSNIWDSAQLYADAFNDSITAKHVFFVYTLYEAVIKHREELREEMRDGTLTDRNREKLAFLIKPGAPFLVVKAVSSIMEDICGQRIPNFYTIGFNNNLNRQSCIELWKSIVTRVTSRHITLGPAADGRLSKKDIIDSQIRSFAQDMGTFEDQHEEWFSNFRENISYT